MFKPLLYTLLATSLFVSPIAFSAEKTSVTVTALWKILSYAPSVSDFAFHRLKVLETLVDASVKGVLKQGLATEWSVSEGGLTWSFTLRSDVVSHDGAH